MGGGYTFYLIMKYGTRQMNAKMCAPQSDKTTCCTFIVCRCSCVASTEYGIAVLFAKCATIFPNVQQSLNCGALQDGTL